MLTPDAQLEVAVLVRSGFYSKERLLQLFRSEMYAPGELDPMEVRVAVDAAFSGLVAEQSAWVGETDCDKLDRVFAALNEIGVIALQNAGYTQSDGYDDVCAAFAVRSDRNSVLGYCFYHGQDLERAVVGEGLLLAFGPMDPEREETLGPDIGRLIVAALTDEGFTVRWDGTFAQRIYIPKIDWKRRAPAD